MIGLSWDHHCGDRDPRLSLWDGPQVRDWRPDYLSEIVSRCETDSQIISLRWSPCVRLTARLSLWDSPQVWDWQPDYLSEMVPRCETDSQAICLRWSPCVRLTVRLSVWDGPHVRLTVRLSLWDGPHVWDWQPDYLSEMAPSWETDSQIISLRWSPGVRWTARLSLLRWSPGAKTTARLSFWDGPQVRDWQPDCLSELVPMWETDSQIISLRWSPGVRLTARLSLLRWSPGARLTASLSVWDGPHVWDWQPDYLSEMVPRLKRQIISLRDKTYLHWVVVVAVVL